MLDLNDDSLLLILDQLKFVDLLSVAQTNVKLSRGAAYATRLKYANHKLYVMSANMEPVEAHPFTDAVANILSQILGPTDSITEIKSQIYIKNRDEILNTFKYLGVYNLEFYSAYSSSKGMELMGSMISQFASQTLEKVYFDGSAGVMKYITQPLVNVKSVSFSKFFHANDTEGILINTLFPAVQSLHLNAIGMRVDFLDHHIPNLKHIETYEFGRFDITRLIEKNPQIQNFEAKEITHENLKAVSLLLPNLCTLKLMNYVLREEEIRFVNVTKFTVKSSNVSPENLHFPNLKHFYLELNEAAHLRVWFNFLQRHPHVTEFIIDHFSYSVDDFDQLMSNLPNLTDFSINLSREEVFTANIMSNIQSYQFKRSLEKNRIRVFNLVTENSEDHHARHESYCKLLQENFEMMKNKMEDKWHIIDIPNGLSFERK